MTPSESVANAEETQRVCASGRPPEHAAVSASAKNLGRLSPGRSALNLTSTWAQILTVLFLFAILQTWWAFLIAFILVGALQYALLILLHDASHSLLHPKRTANDLIGLWLIAAPCGSSFFNSRRLHLLHHQRLGAGSADPDFFFYSSGLPYPKDTIGAFVAHFLKLLLGKQIIHTLFESNDSVGRRAGLGSAMKSLFPVAAMQLLLLGAFAIFLHWSFYFLLWVLPLVTLAVFFNGVRTFADHANVEGDIFDEKVLLITYTSNALERFFIAPYHMNHHAEHHFFPFVPHYNLPRLRQLLRESDKYKDQIQWRDTYLGFIREYLQRLRR